MDKRSLFYLIAASTLMWLSCRKPIEDVLPSLNDTALTDNRVDRRPLPIPRDDRSLYIDDAGCANDCDGGQ